MKLRAVINCFPLRRSHSSKSGGSFTVNAPSPTTKSWERGAKLVKNTDTSNQYMEHIRGVHDPSLHVKTLEEELKGTMGQALGKQGSKILNFLNQMNYERETYGKIVASLETSDSDLELELELELDHDRVTDIPESVKKAMYVIVQNHNRLRKEAVHARWELLVHRQAVGFITNNHRFVHEQFPIPELLELPEHLGAWDEEGGMHSKNRQVAKEAVTRNFGDQLDWWERIGRWR